MVYVIVFKVVAVVLALSVIPIAIFSPMVQIVGGMTIGDTLVGEDVSLYDIYRMFLSRNATVRSAKDYQMTDEVRSTMPALITSGCFLALILLLGIATAVVSICCKKKLPTLILSAVSGLAVMGLFRSFKAFAAPYLDGTISIAQLGLLKEGFLRTIVSAIVKLEILQISSAGFLMFGAALALFLWTSAFMLVEIGEKK
ncbi:MAG: hypothetical protein IJT44_08595 [Clostridia bacterium]|nr:hypothetical protein [Clostridia bacterium]